MLFRHSIGKRFGGSLIAVLALSSYAQSAPEEGYVVRLTRPEKVGDTYKVRVVGVERHKERTTRGGSVIRDRDESREVLFEGTAEVLAVDSREQATRIAYVAARCIKREKGKDVEVLRPGQKVIVEAEGTKTKYTVDGTPASSDVATALGVVLVGRKPGSPTSDDVFGTKERKRIGDEWRPNSETAAQDLEGVGVKVNPSRIAGKVKLVGVGEHEGGRVLDIRGSMKLEGIEMPPLPLAQVERASAEISFGSIVPADPNSRTRIRSDLNMKLSVAMRLRNPESGEEALTEAEMEHRLETQFATVKQ